MNQYNKGINPLIVIIIIVAIVIIVGIIYYYATKVPPVTQSQQVQSKQQNTKDVFIWQSDPNIKLCWNVSNDTKGFCDNPTYYADGFIASPNSTPLGAVEYCKHLKQDGITLSDNEINYWRLPTKDELIAAINSRCLKTWPCDFKFKNPYYWSSSLETPKIANIVGSPTVGGDPVGAGASPFGNIFGVRCVH